MENKIFISFASQDLNLAVYLRETIKKSFGIDAFVDTTIAAGERWDFQIEDNIKSADLMLVLCSPATLKRQWVNFEWGAAAGYKQIPIIPLCHSGLSADDIPAFLSRKKVFDIHNPQSFPELAKIIKNVLIVDGCFNPEINDKINEIIFSKQPTPKSKTCQMTSLRLEDGIVRITKGRVIEDRTEDLPEPEWQEQISRMRAFLADPISNPIDRVGVAIGIQNCLLDGNNLFVGVRIKSLTDSYSSGVSIGLGMFNTGYALLRPNNIQSIESVDTLQDLFVTKPQFMKHFVTPEGDVYQLMQQKITITGEKLWRLKLDDNREVVATIFINNSRRYPRFEIGVWKYIDIRQNWFDQKTQEQLAAGIIDGFGEDVFLTYRGDDTPNLLVSYWIWVRDGEVCYWSYPEERLIPRNRPVRGLKPMHAVLLSMDHMDKVYNNPARYAPNAPDEKLKLSDKVLKEQFSLPARALLSCF